MNSWRNVRVAEIMTGNVIRISSDSTLYDSQELMTQSKLTRLVVVDRAARLRGIVTRRDLVRFLSRDRSGRPLDVILVKEAMSSPVITLRPTDTLVQAARIMNRKGISSIVVTDDGEDILGIVTKTDLCFHFSLLSSKWKVKDCMTRKVLTVRTTHSIFFIASVLARQGISRVPVVDEDGKLRGIITLSDIAQTAPLMRPETVRVKDKRVFYRGLFSPNAKLTSMTALDAMTPKPITVTADDSLSHAAEIMVQRGISGLPVLDQEGRLRAIVTKSDIIRALAT